MVTISELELLHAGLGVLMAHYVASEEPACARCLALRISRQWRRIAEHTDLPDPLLRPLYLALAVRWQVRATSGHPSCRRMAKQHYPLGKPI